MATNQQYKRHVARTDDHMDYWAWNWLRRKNYPHATHNDTESTYGGIPVARWDLVEHLCWVGTRPYHTV